MPFLPWVALWQLGFWQIKPLFPRDVQGHFELNHHEWASEDRTPKEYAIKRNFIYANKGAFFLLPLAAVTCADADTLTSYLWVSTSRQERLSTANCRETASAFIDRGVIAAFEDCFPRKTKKKRLLSKEGPANPIRGFHEFRSVPCPLPPSLNSFDNLLTKLSHPSQNKRQRRLGNFSFRRFFLSFSPNPPSGNGGQRFVQLQWRSISAVVHHATAAVIRPAPRELNDDGWNEYGVPF